MKLLATLLCVASLLPAASFQVSLQVSIDTSSLNTQAGTIDIQFNPGSFPAMYSPGTATITNFILSGGGTLGSIASGPDGGASGTLPGPLAIINNDFLNGILYNATFGTTASLLVDFTGDAFTSTGQSILTTLSVNLTGTSSSVVAQADLLGGSQLDTSFSSQEVTFEAAQSPVPEPSTFGLMAAGIAAFFLHLSRVAAKRNFRPGCSKIGQRGRSLLSLRKDLPKGDCNQIDLTL